MSHSKIFLQMKLAIRRTNEKKKKMMGRRWEDAVNGATE
jgi:hypothetical protein